MQAVDHFHLKVTRSP